MQPCFMCSPNWGRGGEGGAILGFTGGSGAMDSRAPPCRRVRNQGNLFDADSNLITNDVMKDQSGS